MTKLSIPKKFEEAMRIAAFAEEGDFASARQMARAAKVSNNKILLGVEDRDFAPAIVRSALSLCRRMDAKLEIMHLSRRRPAAKEVKERQSRMLASFYEYGIIYRPVAANCNFTEVIIRYVAKRRDIVCIVLAGLGGARARKTRAKSDLTAALGKLHCPVVVYG